MVRRAREPARSHGVAVLVAGASPQPLCSLGVQFCLVKTPVKPPPAQALGRDTEQQRGLFPLRWPLTLGGFLFSLYWELGDYLLSCGLFGAFKILFCFCSCFPWEILSN